MFNNCIRVSVTSRTVKLARDTPRAQIKRVTIHFTCNDVYKTHLRKDFRIFHYIKH